MFPLPPIWSSPPVQTAIAILDLGLAVAVTVDVLLKKSDVRAALGWIGAAWLVPFLGPVLYFLFGINRVVRRALRLGRVDAALARAPQGARPEASPHIALLSAISQDISQSPVTGGN